MIYLYIINNIYKYKKTFFFKKKEYCKNIKIEGRKKFLKEQREIEREREGERLNKNCLVGYCNRLIKKKRF